MHGLWYIFTATISLNGVTRATDFVGKSNSPRLDHDFSRGYRAGIRGIISVGKA